MLARRYDLAINKDNNCKLNVQFFNNDNEIIKFEDNAIVYFTVKENYENNEYLFQKTTNKGITYDEEKKNYIIEIETEDTKNLEYKDYVYDITVVRNTGLESAYDKEKTTVLIGNLKIGYITTFEENEVVN